MSGLAKRKAAAGQRAYTAALAGLLCVAAGLVSARPAGAWQQGGLLQKDESAVSANLSPEEQGDVYMARKYFKEAAESYTKALASDPRNSLLQNKLGIAYHQLLEYNAAQKAYRKAIQLNPRFAPAINNLAAVQYSQKHYKDSIRTYLKALKLTPGEAVIYSNLGTAYFALGRIDFAVASYRYALLLDPLVFQHGGRVGNIVHQRDEKNAAQFNFYMAKTYAELKDVDNTVLYLRKAWEEGFADFRKGIKDKAFDFLSAEPKYIELITQIDAAEAKKAEPAR